MKKLIALFSMIFIITSCSLESNNQNIYYELLPVDSYVMPAEFHVNTENLIVVKFKRPTTCHAFDHFYYELDDFTRTVAIQSIVIEGNSGCTALTNEIAEQTLRFKPTETGTYTFKFWKGKDSNGQNLFEEVVIDVI
ncbi:calpain family cysteine peptidase [Flavobacterium urocaniciphilum]|uniref:Uncharacterized protein n=1 Tax=Flavobacterium urocaniciphilum TaxID=1299341 RepID=A0A1H9BMC5_9FLAO|nr:hypothetical protein [Flavobacterium urocaniciphilum]SEP89881.1 hypothetical protein SAMN05444005_10389 [Flavobacterium urocaniciphilum]